MLARLHTTGGVPKSKVDDTIPVRAHKRLWSKKTRHPPAEGNRWLAKKEPETVIAGAFDESGQRGVVASREALAAPCIFHPTATAALAKLPIVIPSSTLVCRSKPPI